MISVDKYKTPKDTYWTDMYGCMIRAKLNPHETKQMHWSVFETLKKPGCSTEEIMKICRKKAEEFYSKVGIIIMTPFFIRKSKLFHCSDLKDLSI